MSETPFSSLYKSHAPNASITQQRMTTPDVRKVVQRLEAIGFCRGRLACTISDHPTRPGVTTVQRRWVQYFESAIQGGEEGRVAYVYIKTFVKPSVNWKDIMFEYNYQTGTDLEFMEIFYVHTSYGTQNPPNPLTDSRVGPLTTQADVERLLRDLETGVFTWYDGLHNVQELP